MNFREVNKKLNELKQSDNKQALEQFRNTKISNGGLMKVLEVWSKVEEITVQLSDKGDSVIIRSQAKPCAQHCGSCFKAVNFWCMGVFNKPRWI